VIKIQIPHWKIIKEVTTTPENNVTKYSNSSLEDNQVALSLSFDCRFLDSNSSLEDNQVEIKEMNPIGQQAIQIPHWKIIKSNDMLRSLSRK